VKGGLNFISESPDISIVDNTNPDLVYQRYNPISEKASSFLLKPSLDLSFYPGGGPIGINLGASYLNVERPQASSFGLDFSQDAIPDDIREPDQLRKLLSRWDIADRVEEPRNNGLTFNAGISIKIGGTKMKKPKADPVIPEPKIEKPKKDKEIVAENPAPRNPKKEKKKDKIKVKKPKAEKVVAEVIKKPKKDKAQNQSIHATV